jgi:hypothetical protein
MKRLLLIIVILPVISGCVTDWIRASKRPAPQPREVIYGLVSFESDPEGAEVYINNSLVGNTPIKELKLASREISIELKLPGYKEWKRKIKVIGECGITVKAVLEKKE